MHDVSREAVIASNIGEVSKEEKGGLADFLSRYKEFINPLSCVLLIIMAWIRGEHTEAGTLLALAASVLSGYPIVRNSIISSIIRRKLNAEVLVTCALVAAIWVGEYMAGAIVVLMMNIGELLEDITIAKTGEAIRSLMALEAETARVIRNGRELILDIEDVMIGDVVLVKTGEKVPVDGTVIEGQGEIDQSPITGESALIYKKPGDEVYGGTLNQIGVLKVVVSRVGRDTTISKIIDLVYKAQAEKPPIERVADRFASWFTPSMLLLAGLVWLATNEVLRAVTVLVVACPCALVIATPTAVVAGIGNAARKGILIKGGAVLEIIGKLTTVVFDKTGTLTYGAHSVRSLRGFGGSSETDVLTMAGTAERHSEHPLAEAILEECRKRETWPYEPDDTQIVVGRGIVAIKGNQKILVGNERLFEEQGIGVPQEAQQYLNELAQAGSTGILVGDSSGVIGCIGIGDKLKGDVHEAISDLRTLGIKKVLMLTGDNRTVAKAISEGSGLDDIFAELLPEDKLKYVQEFKQKGEKVAMVGDGINDAPALMEADVGIAMGFIGTDAAIEAADIALTTDDLNKVSEAIALSRKTVVIIKQSILISNIINLIAFVLASIGVIGPVVGAIVHNIGSVVVIMNSSRLIGYRFKQGGEK